MYVFTKKTPILFRTYLGFLFCILVICVSYGKNNHLPPPAYLLSRLKHLHPFCLPSLGLQMSSCKQYLTQHLANTISFLCLSIASNFFISDASVFMLSSWMIVRRQNIKMPYSTVAILESLLKRNRNRHTVKFNIVLSS